MAKLVSMNAVIVIIRERLSSHRTFGSARNATALRTSSCLSGVAIAKVGEEGKAGRWR